MIENPLPLGLIALNLGLPFAYYFAFRVARAAASTGPRAHLLAPGVAIALVLGFVHSIALLTGSFVLGAVFGVAMPCMLGAAVFYLDARSAPGIQARLGLRECWAALHAERWTLVVVLGVTLLITPLAWRWYLHDELLLTGHLSLVAQIQNGHYPPRHLTFPQLLFRYHYGFDTLAALVTGLWRTTPATAIDLLTLGMWSYTAALLGAVGRALGHRRSYVAVLCTLLCGGFYLGCVEGWFGQLTGNCHVGGLIANPPPVGYFFQHPWGLGLPLALVVGLVATEPRWYRTRASLLLLVLLLAALAIAQFVAFGLALAVIGAATTVHLARRAIGWRDHARVGVAATCGLAMAYLFGGFLLPSNGAQDLEIVVDLGVTDGFGNDLLWHWRTFGVAGVVGIVGLWRTRRHRLELSLAVVLSAAVFLGLRYEHSFDILKFGLVTMLGLGIASACIVDRLLDSGRLPIRLASYGLLGLIAWPGVGFASAFMADRATVQRNYHAAEPITLPSDDREVLAWLRENSKANESVYRAGPTGQAYAYLGGLGSAYLDVMVRRNGYAPALIARRRAMFAGSLDTPEKLFKERLRWVVVEASDSQLEELLGGWVRAGTAEPAMRSGHLAVYRLVGY